MLDLTELNSHIVTDIPIEAKVDIEKTLLEEQGILDLKDVKASGSIYKNSNDDTLVDLLIQGEMILPDAISLEPVSYPFLVDIKEEILENEQTNENSLDLDEFLWQNIVLEIPLKFTTVNDFGKFQGTGWKLLSEDELKDRQNPFNDLKSKLGEE